MRTKTVALAAGGALALTTLGGVAVAVPVLATTTASATAEPTDEPTDDATDGTDGTDAERLAERTAAFAERLAGLVTDGTITQDQADAVAGTLAQSGPGLGGPGGHGGHGGRGGVGHVLREGLAAAATTLGLEQDALRERLQAGESLGEVADAEGVERADLVAALVEAAEAELAERVGAGDLTQERADEITDGLAEKVTESLDRSGPPGRGDGPRGGAPEDGTEGGTDS